ncbi:MAG: restriction endonuclease subunit S [Burkholderiales bacterium]|nr:restriction endonuclease subunit S [Burkholderiales bacterium]
MDGKTIPLSKTTKFIVDNRGRTAPTAEYGIPLIATNCISNDQLYPAYEKLRFVSQETYENWFRSHPIPGDIILTNKGSQNGAICLVPDPVDFVIAQDMVALRANEEVIDPLFLFAALRSADVQRQIKNLDVSGVIPHFKKTDFDKLHLPYPARPVQEAIGRTYFDFCAKIELNRRMNATLEAMARALFQSWFVDFDPVRAKLDGRQPVGLDPATAALFPAHFQHTAEGIVPTGWRVTTLSEVIEIFDSKRIPLSGREREARKGKYPYHGAASVMDYVDDYLFDGIYTLMGEDGSVVNEDGTPVLQYVWGKFWVNNHAHVLRGKNGISTEHLLLHLKGCNIGPFVNGAVQPKLNQGNMNRIPFMLPPPEIGEAFAKTIDPLFAQIRANAEQSRTLATLRDTLLPKLLSGELSAAQLQE